MVLMGSTFSSMINKLYKSHMFVILTGPCMRSIVHTSLDMLPPALQIKGGLLGV